MRPIFKTPIKRYNGLRVRVSQRFGVNPQFYNKFKDAFGNPLKGHNGVDLVLGYNRQLMYGADLNFICKGKVIKTVAVNPMSTKGNGVYYVSETFLDGSTPKYYLIVLWHMAEVEARVGQEVDIKDKAGDMGNSGIVFPIPTIENPYLGVHLHLGVYSYIKKDEIWQKEFPDNGFDGAIDPLPLLGDLNPVGWEKKNTLENLFDRILPLKWAYEQLKKIFKGR